MPYAVVRMLYPSRLTTKQFKRIKAQLEACSGQEIHAALSAVATRSLVCSTASRTRPCGHPT